MIYEDLRREFWKFRLDEKCKAHVFGELYGESEIKIQPKELELFEAIENGNSSQ